MDRHERDLMDYTKEMMEKKILHWNYRGITELPISLRDKGTAIEELYLKENKITVIPPWIYQLTNLTNLYLAGNKLKNLPEEFSVMERLKVLDLSDNDLKVVPEGLKRLKTLRELILDDNSLCQLPLDIADFEELEKLSLCGNNFVSLPEWLGSLNKLQRLLVDNNFLEELPNRLTLAQSLEIVSVCSNRLKHLPLNSFVSPTMIYFSCNSNLNYISYSLLSQFLELGWNDGKSFFPRNLNISEMMSNRVLQLSVDLSMEKENFNGTAVVRLPRQLIRVFRMENREPPSLWELSLRCLFSNNYENYLNISICPKPDMFHSLLFNGPLCICLNNQCHQPMFTEAWAAVGTSEEISLLIVLLFCSQRCSQTFDFLSHGIKVLPWR
ncbi:leucine-rich repeat-containing protein 28 [Fopius arisanus]|uniref:Leucine-rich repeat-containing protein 28 n=2 Tax=Fopius arisanus TaxID=64838 RepID=A0A9R1SU52_9HYME|nr:PREDICTED: leucine-rich repeat-containing protein 28-like [Fopius arisanus]XP_011297187.1 PREDICTED: leucine-rich repeat-containing protein 28-like [Fopius arisanus]